MEKQRSSKQKQGQAAEDYACHYLQMQGLILITRNFNARQGELDLVMLERDTIVFIEVRYRSRSDFGGAGASITRSKQQKIIAAARYFLHHQPRYANYAARFDVIAIQAQQQGWHIDWIPAAFLTN